MKVGTQRTVDRVVGATLCRFLTLFSWRYVCVPSGFRPRRILVIVLSEMGSLVLAKPMFDLIRKRYPEASVHLLVFERNKEILEILRLVPERDILTVSDRSFRDFVLSNVRLFFRFRRLKIDTVLDCELFSRISSLYSLASGAVVRAGFHPHTQEGLFRGGFINRPVLYNPHLHMSHQFQALVESLEAEGVPLVKRAFPSNLPRVGPSALDPREVESFCGELHRDFPQLENRKLVLVHPGGGLLPIRAWPLAYYCEVAGALVQEGFAVGVIGKSEDGRLAQAIAAHSGSKLCLDLTGYTKRVSDLVLLFHRASLLITNDGGPGHFAALTPVPSIVFYGPETPLLYGSLSPHAHFFSSSLTCSPCLSAFNHRKSPCDGNNECLKAIPPGKVLEKAHELLRD
ncbi:MAG: glycosyltransferase family 9 protein [Deltaproteobacteria bacterium]|nr:glycosyltransferase family 9 protein [Deltaproteobacteria bacterium]